MALKLTVMGRVREAPNEYPDVGGLVLHPIAPPVRVGDAWVMPPVNVMPSGTAASIEVIARSVWHPVAPIRRRYLIVG